MPDKTQQYSTLIIKGPYVYEFMLFNRRFLSYGLQHGHPKTFCDYVQELQINLHDAFLFCHRKASDRHRVDKRTPNMN